jgi:hypothetical protein
MSLALVLPAGRRAFVLRAAALSVACLAAWPAGLLRAAELPVEARLVFDVLYGSSQMRIGRAEQRWHVENGRYELQTELIPLLGNHIRYVSKGRLGAQGLVPESFAEYRGRESGAHTHAHFDWAARTLRFGRGDENKEAALEPGAQDVNAVGYQLGWLGGKGAALQVTTGKKVAVYNFTRAGSAIRVTINGREVPAWPLRSIEGDDRTEIWVAPQLGNLPVRVMRIDDDKEVRFVARELQFSTAK